jgi:hypothetical protein
VKHVRLAGPNKSVTSSELARGELSQAITQKKKMHAALAQIE